MTIYWPSPDRERERKRKSTSWTTCLFRVDDFESKKKRIKQELSLHAPLPFPVGVTETLFKVIACTFQWEDDPVSMASNTPKSISVHSNNSPGSFKFATFPDSSENSYRPPKFWAPSRKYIDDGVYPALQWRWVQANFRQVKIWKRSVCWGNGQVFQVHVWGRLPGW